MGSSSSGVTVTARRAGGIFGIRRVLRCPCPSFPRLEIISGLGGSVGILSGLVNRAGASEAILEFVLKLVEGQALAEFSAGTPEFAESSPQSSSELGHPLGSEDQERHHENHHQLHRADTEHAFNLAPSPRTGVTTGSEGKAMG
jgi:hypothetical protein